MISTSCVWVLCGLMKPFCVLTVIKQNVLQKRTKQEEVKRSKDKKRAEQGRECSEHTSIYKILQSCSIFSSLFTSVCLESIFHWTEMFWKQYYLAQNSSTSYLEKFSCMCQKRFHLKKKQSPKCSARTLSLETSVTEDGRNVNQNEYASE